MTKRKTMIGSGIVLLLADLPGLLVFWRNGSGHCEA